jgi:hypothetical protein
MCEVAVFPRIRGRPADEEKGRHILVVIIFGGKEGRNI